MATFITQEYFELIDEKEAKFILEHGEKQLKDILDTSLLIAGRCATLLTLTVGLIVALIGYSVSHYEASHVYNGLVFTSVWGAVYCFAIVLIIAMNFIPRSYLIPGAEPKDFFVDRVFNAGNGDYRMVAIYVNEIIELQSKIDFNKKTNARRWSLFNLSILLLSLLPIVLGLLYWLSTNFS